MAPITKFLVSALTLLLASPALSAPVNTDALSVRQLAGVGAGSDAIFTDTDNGVGYGTENAEDNTADNIRAAKGAVPATPRSRRQLDKIANGAANVANAAGAPAAGNVVQSNGDRIDGQGTSDSAVVGEQVGSDEETVLEQAGSDAP